MPVRYQVPGVYYEPKPRARKATPERTDVAGFVGFEPRVRDGSAASQLIGSPPVGHSFAVDVSSFQLEVGTLRARVPATRDFKLSENATSIPLVDGGAVCHALLAVAVDELRLELFSVAGTVTPAGVRAVAPDDAALEAAVAAHYATRRPWRSLAQVEFVRAGVDVRPLIRPCLPPSVCDDWQDFVLLLGEPQEDGAQLAHAVRAYFTNGGRRAVIAPLLRPRFDDAEGLTEALAAMLGVAGSSEQDATGVERLLLVEEVALLVLPDLHARRVPAPGPAVRLPPVSDDACFQPCAKVHGRLSAAPSTGEPAEPLFDDVSVLAAQRGLIERCIPERWRVLLVLDVPLERDAVDGRWKAPSAVRAAAWSASLTGLGEEEEMSVVALYYPWLLAQDRVDGPVLELPASAFVAGVIARRDLARGVHLAPANETLRGVVGVSWPIDDEAYARLTEPPGYVNVLRPFPGHGVEVWGARTLSRDRWLRYLPVRRCLSAIERRMAVALRELVFEPNDPLLWLRTTQLAFDVLVPLFERGALRGERPDQAFYVRCDESVNPHESVAAGRLVCEVGVAIAAPAEFLVFRVGRAEGALEVVE